MKKSKILVIDDNNLNLRMIELILQNYNYDVITAMNGASGIKATQEQNPDLILLDIMMPVMDGFEVCERLKESPDTRDIPIIFLTSKTDSEGIVKGFELGAADYVTRPFNRPELMARIKTHLSLKESRDKVIELERKNSILAMGTTTNHEINQPLTVLTGNLFLLKESLSAQNPTQQQTVYFRKMDQAVMKIKGLLAKYQNPVGTRLETYSGASKMVVFED